MEGRPECIVSKVLIYYQLHTRELGFIKSDNNRFIAVCIRRQLALQKTTL